AARLHAGVRSLAIGVEGVAGLASSGSPMWEQFTVGGSAVPFADAALMSQRVAPGGLPAGALVGDRLLLWRVDAQLGLPLNLRPYITSASVDRGFDDWQRVAGLDLRMSFRRVPYVRLPNVELELGWARRLTSPDKGRDSFRAIVRYEP